MSKFLSRKFLTSTAVLAVGAVALFLHVMTGPVFVSLAALVLGLYSAGNVAAAHVANGKPAPPSPPQEKKAETKEPEREA